MALADGFSRPATHSLVFKDDFCEFAGRVRDELLGFPAWRDMRQHSAEYGKHTFNPHRQNGITTGHITDELADALPWCVKFRDRLHSLRGDLCTLMNVEFQDDFEIEMNAMAYGEGAWLSPHTDYGTGEEAGQRLIAWMLYLTHPDDREWSEGMGGAVRVWESAGEGTRLRPKFNRFAAFRVSEESHHEIEKVNWDAGWPHCRLALSGWIRRARFTSDQWFPVYLQSADHEQQRSESEASLQGSLALYRLMLQQQTHTGVNADDTVKKLAHLSQRYEFHRAAPAGSSLLDLLPGPSAFILVVDKDRKVLYFGPLDEAIIYLTQEKPPGKI